MREINIGFIGYSSTKFDESRAQKIIEKIFNKIISKYFNKDYEHFKINIVSGGTNLGIPRMVYEYAEQMNQTYGKWFTLIGIMAKEGYNYELYPCDEMYACGKIFGEESELFIDNIDYLYKIGGGTQSIEEYKKAKEKGIVCQEFSL